jgi:hypothetical protein
MQCKTFELLHDSFPSAIDSEPPVSQKLWEILEGLCFSSTIFDSQHGRRTQKEREREKTKSLRFPHREMLSEMKLKLDRESIYLA